MKIKKTLKASLWHNKFFYILKIANFQTIHFSINRGVKNE